MTWFLRIAPRSNPRVRLVCLPYAGAGGAVYRAWPNALPSDVEVVPVELPGRGSRLREPLVGDLGTLADQVATALIPMTDLPMAIFGHSMGSWLALAVARRLEDAGHPLLCLFVSGRQAPSLGCTLPRIGHLEEGAFLDQIEARYSAIPAQIRGDPEMLALVVPALRSDMSALEAYVHAGDPISCALTALAGESDPNVPIAHLAPWAAETTGAFTTTALPGSHFYFQPDPRALLAEMAHRLDAGLSALQGASR